MTGFREGKGLPRPGMKLVLIGTNKNGEDVILDILKPNSTKYNPIIDYKKIGIDPDSDDELYNKVISEQYYDDEEERRGSEISTAEETDDTDFQEDDICETKIHIDDSNSSYTKTAPRTIIHDMVNINIPTNIKEKADEVYNMLNISTKRGARRKKVVFFCIYEAHRLLKIPIDPKDLAEIVGIEKNHISKAFTMCSPIETEYYPPNVKFNFREFIRLNYHLTGLSTVNLEDVLSLADDICQKNPAINNIFPQLVAGAILSYYMDINGVQSKINMAKILRTSEINLRVMKQMIESIHNQ